MMKSRFSEIEKAAYHEIGHVLAMYICYGNIDRYRDITVYWNGAGIAETDSDFYIADKAKYCDFSRSGFDFYFNEVCINVAGGVCEAIMTHREKFLSSISIPIKLPHKNMEGDYTQITNVLSIMAVHDKKDISAIIRAATIYMQRAFIPYLEKIEELARFLLYDDDECYMSKLEFYKIMNPTLYRKERRRLRKKNKEKG